MLKGEGKNILIYIVVLAIVFTTMYIIFSEKEIKFDANGFPLGAKEGDKFTINNIEYVFSNGVWKEIIIGPPIDPNSTQRTSFVPCSFDPTLDCSDPVIVVRPNRIGQFKCPDGSLNNPNTGLCPPIVNFPGGRLQRISLDIVPRDQFNQLSISERQILARFYDNINKLSLTSENILSKQSLIDGYVNDTNSRLVASGSNLKVSFNKNGINPNAKISCSCENKTVGTICNCWGIFNFFCHCRLKVDEKFFE